jgi:hypothetical protein
VASSVTRRADAEDAEGNASMVPPASLHICIFYRPFGRVVVVVVLIKTLFPSQIKLLFRLSDDVLASVISPTTGQHSLIGGLPKACKLLANRTSRRQAANSVVRVYNALPARALPNLMTQHHHVYTTSIQFANYTS